jgi:hypothetical protein
VLLGRTPVHIGARLAIGVTGRPVVQEAAVAIAVQGNLVREFSVPVLIDDWHRGQARGRRSGIELVAVITAHRGVRNAREGDVQNPARIVE